MNRVRSPPEVALADPVFLALATTLDAVHEGLVGSLVHMAVKTARTHRRREMLTRPDRVVDSVERRFERLRRQEFAGLPGEEWVAAVHAVRDSLAAAVPIDPRETVLVLLDAERLERHVRARSGPIRAAALLSGTGREAYDRVLSSCCTAIVQQVHRLPEVEPLFRREAIQRIIRLDEGLDRRLDDHLDRVEAFVVELLTREDSQDRDFEGRYLQRVERVLGWFELFGASRGRTRRRHSFDRSYVTLSVARTDRSGDPDADLSGAGVAVTHAFSDVRRVLLRGGAGAGKTTFLHWLATSAVHGRPDEPLNGSVPFFVPLRRFADRALPRLDQLVDTVADLIADEMPDHWVADRFREGRALVLVDGLDELVIERREEVRDWLEQLVDGYPESRYVVTTRPSAVAEDWLADAGFVAYDLLPMSHDGVHRFIARWHQAVREDHAGDDGMVGWLNLCEQRLTETLDVRSELRRLTASPLLCGLLCALHMDQDMHLPRDRRSLYEAALELLLRRWDEQRGLGVSLSFSKEERMVLLQRFAYSLVRNRELSVSRGEAARRFRHAMSGLRPHAGDPDAALQNTLERTGLLREPYPDQIQFVHRTFRDYLAAKELVEAGDIGLLMNHAHLDEWHEIVVMAVAHSRRGERGEILRGLLDGNPQVRKDSAALKRLHLLAASCLGQADVVEPEEVRHEVERAVARLIPPANPYAAEMLARAGEFVLDLLPGPAGLSEAQAANVVRTAAMIGGPMAVPKIREFATRYESVVLDELLRAWRLAADPEDYAKTVLADVDFGERRVDMSSWRRMRYVKHLRRLSVVRCVGSVDGLADLAAAPRLWHLELMQNDVVFDLSPLIACRTLRSLHLNLCSRLRDLSPLADTTIEELALHFTPADLGTLRAAGLRRLIIGHPDLDGGLYPLSADLPLRELVVDNRPPRRNLAGVQRWRDLEAVSVIGVPAGEEVALLAELPALRHLHIQDGPAPNLAEVAKLRRSLPNVQVSLAAEHDQRAAS